MRKGLFYICLLLVGVGLFAGCKSKKAVVASFSDWMVNGVSWR